jgi:dephospho-CoA kinase
VLRIGVTGGIGSGKSTAARQLADLGARLIDADQLAREVVVPGSPGLAAVVHEFGDAILRPDGSLDRPALARAVFGDQRVLSRLNAIMHPRIAARTAELIAETAPDAILVNDMPLIVENGLAAGYHLVVVVHASAELRVQRLVEQRGLSEVDARSRISAQATDDQRRAVADVWLDNSGDPAALIDTVQQLWHDRLVPFGRNLRLRQPAERPPEVQIVDADPSWADQAERLRARIAAAADSSPHRLDHTGSTSVPGLAAKDVIDLQLVVPDLAVADRLTDPLADAGFVRLPGDWRDDALDGTTPAKRVHVACDPGRAVNLHVRTADSPAVREQLVLRDWLRAHPDERDAYAAVKRRSAAAGEGIEQYLERKGPWVRGAFARALAWDDAGRPGSGPH